MSETFALTGQDIGEAYGAVQSLLERALAGAGTTSSEYVVLRVLAARGPVESPASLHQYLTGERQLDLAPEGVAELLARLEARSLAAGTAQDGPGPATLTPQGAELLRGLTEIVVPRTKELFSGIPADDLATAHDVLRQIIDRASGTTSTLSD